MGDVRCVVTCIEVKPDYLESECCCLKWGKLFVDRDRFHSIFTLNKLFAKLLKIMNNSLKQREMILFCLRQREAVLQPTTTGQLWYFGSSFGKLWQFKKKKRYSNKPSQSLHHLEAGCHIEVLVNLHYWCISTVSVFRCLLKELSDLMVANSILSFQPPSRKSYFTFCFNQSGMLVPISHWWLIWSCSLINKDDLNVFYSQTYNSVAELNS